MKSVDSRPVCARCGDHIGVYEPIWLEQPDGTRVRSGLLALEDAPLAGRLFHSGCLASGSLTG
jgi:hypothetical protein